MQGAEGPVLTSFRLVRGGELLADSCILAPNARGEPRQQLERRRSGGCWRRLQCLVRPRPGESTLPAAVPFSHSRAMTHGQKSCWWRVRLHSLVGQLFNDFATVKECGKHLPTRFTFRPVQRFLLEVI